MAWSPFNGMQPAITNRFGWPGLSGMPQFPARPPVTFGGQPSPAGGPPASPGMLSSPAMPAGMLNRGGMGNDNALARGNAGMTPAMSPGTALGSQVAQGMGAGLSAGTPMQSSPMGQSTAPGLLDDRGNPYSRTPDGGLGIDYVAPRGAWANPLDFVGSLAGALVPGLGSAIGIANEYGHQTLGKKTIPTLGRAIEGVPQTSQAMGGVYGYGPNANAAASPTLSQDVASLVSSRPDLFGKAKPSVQRQGGGGNAAGGGGGNARSQAARDNVRDQMSRSFAGTSGRTLAR